LTSAILLIPGNTNTTSFGNCITAATEALRENRRNPSASFEKVHVLHTRQSLMSFSSWKNSDDWLRTSGLQHSDLVHHVIEINQGDDQRLDKLVSSVAEATSSKLSSECYFDLTGGITQTKVALAILAFLLGSTNVYTLEIDFDNPAEQREWPIAKLRDAGVSISYRKISGLERFDSFGLANLTSVVRVNTRLADLRKELEARVSNRKIEVEHLISVLRIAEKSHLDQLQRIRSAIVDEHAERASTRSLLFHSMAAAEALIDLIVNDSSGLTLGRKLQMLKDRAEASSPHPIDSQTLRHLSELLLRLRNRAAHWSDTTPDLHSLVLQGELGLNISRSFIWLLTMSLESLLNETGEITHIQIREDSEIDDGEWFVGIDGDATGGHIARTMRNSADCGQEIKEQSKRISTAIDDLRQKIVARCGKKSILFATGDNILFSGKISASFIRSLLSTYQQKTQLTASAGIGRTPHQAAIALSLAKAEGGGTMKVITIADD